MKTRNRTGILSMATLASAVLMSSAADARELNYALGCLLYTSPSPRD